VETRKQWKPLIIRGARQVGKVKTEVNLQAKSLKIYRDKFNTVLSIRTSMADYLQEEWLLNLPLWAIETLNAAVGAKADHPHS
jgi:hypothetical protein